MFIQAAYGFCCSVANTSKYSFFWRVHSVIGRKSYSSSHHSLGALTSYVLAIIRLAFSAATNLLMSFFSCSMKKRKPLRRSRRVALRSVSSEFNRSSISALSFTSSQSSSSSSVSLSSVQVSRMQGTSQSQMPALILFFIYSIDVNCLFAS